MNRRAQTRASSRLLCVSRASNASSSTSSSVLDNLLDDFDLRVSTPTPQTANLLFPRRENPEYESIHRVIQSRRNVRKIDLSATLIQKTFRMFKIRKEFRKLMHSHHLFRTKNTKIFFYNILLTTINAKVDRRRIFNKLIESSIFSYKYFKGYKPATNEIFAATGLVSIPPCITGEKLAKFVKLMFGAKLRQYLIEWHLAARKLRYLANQQKNFRHDKMSLIRCGNFYACFILWYNYTKLTRNKIKDLTTGQVPQWDNFMKNRDYKFDQIQKAHRQRSKILKENSIQALRMLVLQHRRKQFIYEQSVQFNTKKKMKLALAGWVKFLIMQQNKSVTMRFVFRRWLQAVQRRKHAQMLLKAFKERHEYYQKRYMISLLLKNRKVSKCLNMYQYLRIMQKPSLAMYFVSLLRKDPYSEAISHTFSAWISFVRRRRRWMHYVFSNEVATEYTPKKKVILAAFRRRPPPPITPICLYSGRFKKESVIMYHDVMNEQVDPAQIYLVVNGDTPEDIKQKAQSTRTQSQQRKIFFKLWLTQKNDMSLFMRTSIVYCAKKQSQNQKDSETPAEQCFRQYKKVIAFLAEMNLASDGKFTAAQNTIIENNKRNLQNRKACIHRDNLIILAHDSHNDAVDLHSANDTFKADASFVQTQQIVEASESLVKSFQPLIPLTQLGHILEQPNENKFVWVLGCSSKLVNFRPTIHECHLIIHNDMVRSEIGHDVASRFDRLLAGRDVSASNSRNRAHSNSRVDAFSRFKGDEPPKSRPSTGFNEKLSSKFPLKNRKGQVMGKETGEFNMPNAPTEEEDTLDSMLMSESLSMVGNTSSMFYNGLGSLSSLMQNASMNIFNSMADKSNEFILNNINEEIRINQMEKIQEEKREIIKPKRKVVKQVEEKPMEATEIDYTLVDGFDKATMLSLKQARDVQSPKASKKYKLFLEILFGRAGKDANNAQISALRRKIITEYRMRKPSLASNGIATKGSTRPITALLESYRRESTRDYSSESTCRKDQRPQKEKSKMTPEEQPNEYIQTYNAHRFRKITPEPKKKNEEPKKHSFFSGSGSDSDSFREDLMDDDNRGQNIITDVDVGPTKHEDEVFEDVDIDPAAEPEIPYFPFLQRKYSTSTPYTSLSIKDTGALGKVNKIAIGYLRDQIKDENGEGLLVDVDPIPMPSLDLGPILNGQNHFNMDDEGLRHRPGYRQRGKIKPPNKRNKRTVPIIIPNRRELSPEMKKTLIEDDSFSKMYFTEGQTKYVRGKKSPVIPYYPPFKLVEEPDEGDISKSNGFVEGQLVSFKGGGRQQGRESPNFTPVRIKTGNQRKLTKPLVSKNSGSMTVPSTPIVDGTRSKSQMGSGKKGSNNTVKNVVTDFINTLAADSEVSDQFDDFRERVRLSKAQTPSHNFDQQDDNNKNLFDSIQLIITNYGHSHNFYEAADALVKLSKRYIVLAPVLFEAVDVANKSRKDVQRKEMKRTKTIESLKTEPSNSGFSSNFLEMSWMADNACSYKAVAIQYKEESDESKPLEAIVANTEPSKKTQRKMPTYEIPKTKGWDDVIKDYSISEMLLVTPYIIPEQVVDSVVNAYRKTRKPQKH
ncbi:hypothetical protein TRFO_12139 [Tritrichomonas foetus]|uniref:IQ calmodulin-binding motif family protein n=1 Tax=Tritrichomonas foetus TaxID=1144522 RepID=A0A1J4J5N2_9EUKA|nr:hypothetical protein TRFO_12139 [Tritrichomonas foetus]|eukprot:OHS92955.1 hypothetical protein TRFO_12139 [Tritrichomonas foetus]